MEKTDSILIVEDDLQIKNFIKYALEKQGYHVFGASNGQNALNILVKERINLMLLDLGLPDLDGMEILKRVREWSEIPIIIVSARDQDKEKVIALDEGADDYLTKPFSANELLARIRVAMRHARKLESKLTVSSFELDDLKIDYEKHMVYKNKEAIHLTPMEYKMLMLLSKNAGKVITTGFLLKQIWGANYGTDTQALRALMAGLRRKIEDIPAKPRFIITEVGVGYRFVDE